MKIIRYVISAVLVISLLPTAFAQSYRSAETIAYIEQYHKVAIREMYKYKIPASITLAQGVLESGSGRSDLSTVANNHFGIKCTSDYTGKKFLKDDNKKDDCFRVYEHADGSYRDHSLFLTTRKHYSNLFKLDITDYKGWAKGLKAAGYATNPKYPSLLIAVIEQNKLYEYDRHPEKYISKADAENFTLDGINEPEKQVDPKTEVTDNSTDIAPAIVNGKLNGIACVVVKSGDTFYSLSRRHEISIDKLRYYNDFPEDYVLRAGENLFLERKQRKNPDYPIYTVQKGDTFLSICQKFGVRMRNIRRYNHLESDNVKEGQVIILNW